MTALQYDKDATERLLAMYVTPDVVAPPDATETNKAMEPTAPHEQC